MKDILGQDIAIGDHVVYAKVCGHSSLYMGLMVVVRFTPKGIAVVKVDPSRWEHDRELALEILYLQKLRGVGVC